MKKLSIFYLGILMFSIFSSFLKPNSILFAEDKSKIVKPEKTEVIYLIKYFYEDERDPKKATAKIISEGETIGFFSEIYWGDYAHFCIKDIQGKEDSFFISDALNTDSFINKFEKDKKSKGIKVKVIWHKVEIYIPEAGGNQEIIVMVGFKLL